MVKNSDQVLIGSNEYVPVCEKCYDYLNSENVVIDDFANLSHEEKPTKNIMFV